MIPILFVLIILTDMPIDWMNLRLLAMLFLLQITNLQMPIEILNQMPYKFMLNPLQKLKLPLITQSNKCLKRRALKMHIHF